MCARNVKRGLNAQALNGNAFRMSEGKGNKMSREERLAAKMRENLKRRKAQAREMSREMRAESPDKELPKGDSES